MANASFSGGEYSKNIPSLRQSTLITEVLDIKCEPMGTSFFLASDTAVPKAVPRMALCRKRLLAWMHQNAAKPSNLFSIPTNRVVEVGAKVEI
jgi:KUP system potassium uptake protein